MKRHLVLANVVVGAAFEAGAWFAPQPFWQPLLINLGTTFLAVAVAVVVVNIYLERDSRRDAVRSLLMLTTEAIADFHNKFCDLVWSQFSKAEFDNIRTSYMKAKGDIMVLTPDQRSKVYQLAKSRERELRPLIERLNESLTEVTSLVGWSMDARLLTQALQARNSIRKFRGMVFDDEVDTINKVAEHFIDIDTFSAAAHAVLAHLGGLRDGHA